MSETTVATGKDVHGLRWSLQKYDEPGFTEYYLNLGDTRSGGKSVVLNDELIAALEKLPELS